MHVGLRHAPPVAFHGRSSMESEMTHHARPSFETSKECLHVKARSERPNDYPERFPVPDSLVKWRAPYPEYAPPRYESARMLEHSPDPKAFKDLERSMRTYEKGGIRIDGASGEPLNPKGRTGISGRGALWMWGPNHAADFLLTRYNQNTQSLEALLIQRKSGQWAIPGGMVDAEESSAQAAMRELKEEANISAHATSRAWELYRGYVDDPRNTDNAWMETTVFHEHLGGVTHSTDMQPSAGDDAKAAAWTPLTSEFIRGLFASHPDFIERGLHVLVEAPGTDTASRAAAAQLLKL